MNSGKLEVLALKWTMTESLGDYLFYAKDSTAYTDNNPLTYELADAKLKATGQRFRSL